MWYTVAVGALINMLLLWMFNLKLRTHLLLGGLISFFTGTMICLIVLLDNPFRGEVGVSPQAFLDYVHDIDLSSVAACPELAAALDALPGRKFIFTNGSRKHAEAVASRLGVDGRFAEIFDIHALEYIHPKPTREAYERFVRASHVVPRQTAMFDDLPNNLETAHMLGMTTVLVHGVTDHPQHQAIAGWTELPAHIHHRTDALAPFLAAIGTSLAATEQPAEAVPYHAQFCLT